MKIINDTFNCGVRTIVAQPEGVCSQAIELKLFGDEIAEVNFYGGCSGNLKESQLYARDIRFLMLSRDFRVSLAESRIPHVRISSHSCLLLSCRID